MSERNWKYWHQALLQCFGEAEEDTEEEWFFFHWFWSHRGVETVYH